MNPNHNLQHQQLLNSGFFLILFCFLSALGTVSSLNAAIVPTGNVSPTLPWTRFSAGYVGNTSDGSLTVDAGSLLQSSTVYVASESGVTGTLTVTGAGTKWNNYYSLFVGYSGSGTLIIEAGAQVSNAVDSLIGYSTGSLGTVKVTGNGSQLTNGSDLYLGRNGSGILTIEDGAQVSNSIGYLGYIPGSTGTVKVTGSGSKWTNNSDLYVGRHSSGTLSIEASAQVSNSIGYLGYYLGCMGMATVTGSGSRWINNADLFVGRSGSGTLNIGAGGQVSNSFGHLGYNSGSSGTATVTGAGSKWTNSSDLYVGENGSGTLNIEDGAEVSNPVGHLGYNSGSMGSATVTGAGSKWNISSVLYVSENGSGTLTVADGGEVITGTLWASLNDLRGNGTITVTKGAYLNADLRFDATHGTQANVTFGAGGTLKVNAGGGNLCVGYKEGSGSLTVAEGVNIASSNGYLGYDPASTGTATVTGTGSKWTNSNTLYVGRSGSGTLTVADGGEVTTGTLWASLNDLRGNGTITVTKGAYLNADLRFDATHGTQANVTFGDGGTLKVNAGGGSLCVGYKEGSGSLTVSDGVNITSSISYLGYDSATTGTATITGTNSKWTIGNTLYVGQSGSGSLTIEAGAQVSNYLCYIGYNSGSKGVASVTGIGSYWATNDDLYLGYSGSGKLTIADGARVASVESYVGLNSGSMGTVTVSGVGTTWYSGSYLYIGHNGSGSLTIEDGAQVNNSQGSYLGYSTSSTGTALVCGAGSKWNNNGRLSVGWGGTGKIHIRNGGNVTASVIEIYRTSLLTIDVGYGSEIRIGGGTGTIYGYNNVRVLTGPNPTAGSQFSPLFAGTWAGGTFEALGGSWNTTSHVFTVSPTLTGVSGIPITIDLAQKQRVLVEENSNHWTLGASLLAKTGSGNVFNFTATALAGADLTSLQAMLAPGQSVLSGWNFLASGSGYNANDPIYLSLGIPSNLSRTDLQLWRLNNGNWSCFTVDDLTSASGYASFTVTGLSDYAVTASLPSSTWNMDADGSWQNGSNWTNAPFAPSGVNVVAILGPAITAPRTVTLAGPLTLGVLTLDSPQHYTLAGSDSLTLQVNPGYNAKIDVQASDANGHIIETPITLLSPLNITIAPATFLTLAGQVQNPAGQTMTLSGGGTSTVTQGIATSGTINVLSGTLITPSLAADTLTIGNIPTASLSAVPEPSTTLLLLAAIAAITSRFLLRMKTPQL